MRSRERQVERFVYANHVVVSPDDRSVYGTAGNWISPESHSVVSLSREHEVFADGFESGDTSAWSFTVP